MKKQNASVLLFSLMIISIIIIMTEQMIRGVMVGTAFTKTMVNRERAEMLALGGINIAIAQLTYKHDNQAKDQTQSQTDTTDKTDKDQKVSPFQRFFFQLISNLNRWQTFELDQKNDGMDGTIKICITSEHGKININNAYDFKKQEFKKEFKFLLGGLEIPGKIPTGELFNKISEYLKKRGKKLYDVSELLNIPGLENLDIFYDPPKIFAKGRTQANTDIALQDMFTTWTDNDKIDPILISDALCAVLVTRRPRADDAKKLKEQFKKLTMEFKDDWGKDWDANWKHLEGVFDSKPPQLSNIKDILVEKFNPKVYSVLSYGKVGQVEQRVLAVIKEVEIRQGKAKGPAVDAEKDKGSSGTQQSQEQKDSQEKKRKFKIERIYWL